MITISILALRNVVLASIADTRYMFTMVNQFLVQAGKEPLFRIQMVGNAREVKLNEGLFTIHPDVLLNEAEKNDLVIIPSLTGDMMSATHVNREYGFWIAQQYKRGVEIASLCSGAFLLAFSGILKGKQCTTHWQYANEFKHYYPNVKLVDEKTVTHQNGVYSSGGSNAYWNLLIHLVEKYAGREMAIYAAKYFVIDFDRTIQSPFVIFHGLKDHEDETILNAQEFIEQNFSEKLTVDQLAEKFNSTRRTFERRFKKATRNTVAEYIQRVKIEAAKTLLETGRKTVQDIMYEVGYVDIQTFRDVFKKITGMTPVEYMNKYNR